MGVLTPKLTSFLFFIFLDVMDSNAPIHWIRFNMSKFDFTPLDSADIRFLRWVHDILIHLSTQELLTRIYKRYFEGTTQNPQTEITNASVLILMECLIDMTLQFELMEEVSTRKF